MSNTDEQQTQPKPTPLTPQVVDAFIKVTKAISELTESSRNVAQEGPAFAMLIYGWMMILCAIGLKITPMVHLETAEFSVLIVTGTVFFLASAAARLYQFKVQCDIDREIRQQAYQTLNAQQTAALSDAKTGGGKDVKV